jgi:hypothetical protein
MLTLTIPLMAVVLGRLASVLVVLSEHSSDYARKRFSQSQVRRCDFYEPGQSYPASI